MAGKQLGSDGLSTNLAGMSKNQLYDIMSQMKTLIEQNEQQARQILIQNPLLTKALFQAQIMLGMVKPPQAIPNVRPPTSQQSQQTMQPPLQANIQSSSLASQLPNPSRDQQQSQLLFPSTSIPHLSQPLPSNLLQPLQPPRGQFNPQTTSLPLQKPAQVPNLAPLPLLPTSQPPSLPPVSTQLQQPSQTSGIPLLPLQTPLPPQSRPPQSVQAFTHQLYSQMGPNAGFQNPGAPQLHHSPSMFLSGVRPQVGITSSLSRGQSQLPNQMAPQSLYQRGASHGGMEFSQIGSSTQPDKGLPSWMPSHQLERITQPSGPSPFGPGPGSQTLRPPSLSPDVEKALLQQVMSLTPEQVNLLPPDQRSQVLQLQQIMRQ